MQDRSKVASVTIPALGSSTICPVSTLSDMLQVQTSLDDPLFHIQTSRGITPLTDSVSRKHLKQVSIILNTPKILTFHDFRRAGATRAFRAGIPIHDIQAQGTWSSDCVWCYIQLPPLLFKVASTSTHIFLHDAFTPTPYLGLWPFLTPLCVTPMIWHTNLYSIVFGVKAHQLGWSGFELTGPTLVTRWIWGQG